jgi:hypothetical protein
MAVTVASFLVAFPELAPAGEPLIAAKLAEAARSVNANVWGVKTDDGVSYLAAHLLACSPYGENARLSSDKGESTYGRRFEALRWQVGAGLRHG